MENIAEFTPEFFEKSSTSWRQNKIHLGDGIYKYKKNAFSVEESLPKAPRKKKIVKESVIDEKEPPILRRSRRIRELRHMNSTGMS
jgi:hypothetical protein